MLLSNCCLSAFANAIRFNDANQHIILTYTPRSTTLEQTNHVNAYNVLHVYGNGKSAKPHSDISAGDLQWLCLDMRWWWC